MDPLNEVAAQQTTQHDLEKHGDLRLNEKVDIITKTGTDTSNTPSSIDYISDGDIPPTPRVLKGRVARWNEKIESLAGLEARGITRVLPGEKHNGGIRGYVQMFLLWFGINIVVLNIITGLLGPLIFALGWKDCVCIAIFANMLSCCGPAYTSTFGPQSGNRTMIIGRYFMGYWPSKLACILNVIMQVGWGTIGCIIAGQMISAVNGHGLTIAVGCVIGALLIGLIAAFGIGILYRFEKFAAITQAFAMLILVGSSGKYFDTSAVSVGDAGTVNANRCSFFALVFASVIGFTALGADYYVYYPINTSKRATFAVTWLAVWLPAMCCNLIGVGIATGVASNPTWGEAYEISSGALLLQAYDGLGGFGAFCVVILAAGSITNNAPCSYAAALTIQALGRYGKAIPRYIWCLAIMVVELVLSVAGRDHLFTVFQNFLPLTAYWVCPWIAIVLEEHLFFHTIRGVGFNWAAWEDRKHLPIGAAALFAWLCGWAGAIVGMHQTWYTGPVAAKVGGYGADIGAWMAIGFAWIVYPPLRYLEWKKIGR